MTSFFRTTRRRMKKPPVQPIMPQKTARKPCSCAMKEKTKTLLGELPAAVMVYIARGMSV